MLPYSPARMGANVGSESWVAAAAAAMRLAEYWSAGGGETNLPSHKKTRSICNFIVFKHIQGCSVHWSKPFFSKNLNMDFQN